jgi:hypothetical protein
MVTKLLPCLARLQNADNKNFCSSRNPDIAISLILNRPGTTPNGKHVAVEIEGGLLWCTPAQWTVNLLCGH